jgi:hypothetical protein
MLFIRKDATDGLRESRSPANNRGETMKTSRRGFLSAAAAAGTWALARPASGEPPKRGLKLGVIGVGWYGMVDAKAALKAGGVEIAAVSDVDSQHLVNSAGELEKLQGKRPLAFKHYEELLDSKGLKRPYRAPWKHPYPS